MQYKTKDSGKRVGFKSGMVRDIADDKPRYDLIPIWALKRLAELYGRGAKKYGDNNWQLANSGEELQRFKGSAWRHFTQYMQGDQDEDHMAAIMFNIIAHEQTKNKIEEGK